MSTHRLHFEQIPVALVKEAIKRAAEANDRSASCHVCGQAVRLEECNTDELGRAVHPACYVESMERPRCRTYSGSADEQIGGGNCQQKSERQGRPRTDRSRREFR